MGGQHDYFGLWLDSDFGRGHSRARPTCTTYGSPQLSAEEDFSLDSMEVWAVGKPPEPEDVRPAPSSYLPFPFYSLTGTETVISVHLDRESTARSSSFHHSCLVFFRIFGTGGRGSWQKERPGHGSGSSGHYGDDGEVSAQPGTPRTGGGPGRVRKPWKIRKLVCRHRFVS